jgi:CBS domain containing-hemolysin-like protein
VLEEIVGDLPREEPPDAGTLAEQIDENTYRLAGRASVRAWCSLWGIAPAREPADTLGGWVTARLGRLPRVGDTVRTGNLTLTVESVQRRRVDRLILKRDPNGQTEDRTEPTP